MSPFVQIGLGGNMPAAEVTNKTVNCTLLSFAAQALTQRQGVATEPRLGTGAGEVVPNTRRDGAHVSELEHACQRWSTRVSIQRALRVLSDILP